MENREIYKEKDENPEIKCFYSRIFGDKINNPLKCNSMRWCRNSHNLHDNKDYCAHLIEE